VRAVDLAGNAEAAQLTVHVGAAAQKHTAD
jgi:hypothetical protein